MFQFALSEDGKLLAAVGHVPVLVFADGVWLEFKGVLGEWISARLLTEDEAARMTSGVMPEYRSSYKRFEIN